jgi:hypothetical protein
MADWHLKGLRDAMESSGWRFVAEHASDHLYVSASWEFEGNKNEPHIFIDFEGIDDLRTLPIDESYACHVRNNRSLSLYFGRKGEKGSTQRETWKKELHGFVASLRKSVK